LRLGGRYATSWPQHQQGNVFLSNECGCPVRDAGEDENSSSLVTKDAPDAYIFTACTACHLNPSSNVTCLCTANSGTQRTGFACRLDDMRGTLVEAVKCPTRSPITGLLFRIAVCKYRYIVAILNASSADFPHNHLNACKPTRRPLKVRREEVSAYPPHNPSRRTPSLPHKHLHIQPSNDILTMRLAQTFSSVSSFHLLSARLSISS
jgi:hypothetical protein